ncbi:regulator of nonsense transcript protein [Tasmannia lanceolata]|uniref:regulator of nonsense transcript protein n=1 Tax=Tasmannia lanceolata TaxID=3420 RepID=UPI004063C444
MKLLGWMHRKFKQNNTGEPFKDFAIGNSCNCLSGRPSLDEQQLGPKHGFYSRPSLRSHPKDTFRKSFAGLEEEEEYDEENIDESEIFHGLLAIGTLGSAPVDTITEKQTEVTENDLRLINDELEKVLVIEEGSDVSSARNSHVSVGKQMATDGNVCPLQGYLFGSPIELAETEKARAKKEQRTSLGELFLKSRMAEEKGTDGDKWKCEREEKEKSGVHLVKKMLKRRTLSRSSASVGAATGTGNATATATNPDHVSADTKLNKILQIFHRKVHPESSTTMKKPNKSEKYEIKNNISYGGGDGGGEEHGNQSLHNHHTLIFPRRAIEKDHIRHYKCNSNASALTLDGSDSNGNREYWIKTDADYLVLEL